MSRITQKSAVAPLSPWVNISSGVPNQAFSAIPGAGPQPASATGFYEPSISTCVGQKFDTSDGRELVLVQNGAVALTAGKLIQTVAETTAFEKLAMTVPTAQPATAGTFAVLVTNGATVLNANQFQGGFLVTASGTGLGQLLKIQSHQPAAASATFIVTLEDPIQTTLDVTTTVSLVANPYLGVIINPTTPTGTPVGVTLYNIAASTAATYDGTSGKLTVNGVAQYGLVTCHGLVSVLMDSDASGVGVGVGPSDLTAGAVGTEVAGTQSHVGITMQTSTSAQYVPVYLTL